MKPCLKRFAGNPSTDESSAPRVSHGASDMKRRKRVKFVEGGAVPSIGCQRDVSSPSSCRLHAPGSDEAKTSEYKYFKKLLEEAGRSSHSHEPVGQANNILSTGHRGDLRNKQTRDDAATGSVLLVEKVTPIKQLPSLASIGTLDDKELQCKGGGTFYDKRQNLIRSAASALSLEANDLLSKGSGLIPALLYRIGIKRKADNDDELQKMSIKNLNVRPQLLACPNMQSYLDEPFETLEIGHTSTVASDITENNFSGGWWKRANELCGSMEHVEAQCFPIWNMTVPDLPKNSRHLCSFLESSRLPAKNKSNLDFNPSAEVASSRWKQPMFDNKMPTPSWVDHELSPIWRLYEEQPVSHSNFHLLKFDILHSPAKTRGFSRQHSSLPLMEWDEEISNEEEPFAASDGTGMKGLCKLPLSLCHVSRSPGLIVDSGVDTCMGADFFHSFDDIRILKDMIPTNLDHVLLPTRAEFAVGSEWENLSADYCRELLLSYNTSHQFGSISRNAFQRCLIEPSDTESRSQVASMICDLYDLSSFGFGKSPERNKMFFLPVNNE